ncbi:MAG: TIGR01777 family oxidoreductase [Vampirovibrio sp.]|nr:TIGR01777 family oxidoreductase [Vampirovibrio sp.]
MKILVSGSHGLVGSALIPFLKTGGHEIVRLVRSNAVGPNQIRWDMEKQLIDTAALEGFDAVIHLAGENIANGRWSAAKKKKIFDSRVHGTRFLADTLAKLDSPPKVFISASAIGYYGNAGDEILSEVSDPGKGFLADTCWNWESASDALKQKDVRVVHARFGVVLSPKGGALAQMLPIFQLGGGGPLGNGKQYLSWVALDDVVGALGFLLNKPDAEGPYNIVGPEPVSNKEYSRTLGKVLMRPAFAPVPGLAVRAMFGEMGDELLLSSTRVEPARLQETGYKFQCPTLERALRQVLGQKVA